jgi:hypothetical protein
MAITALTSVVAKLSVEVLESLYSR